MGNERALGCKHSEEANQKKSTDMSGENNPFYGKKHTGEALKKVQTAFS